MPDVHDEKTRSRNMAAVRSKNTCPELWLRFRLHAKGFRYRLHEKKLPGKPDIVLPKYKCVIFVHGCFWHMHRCDKFSWPLTNAYWWRKKLEMNLYRDLLAQDKLRELGWRVLILWECAIRGHRKMPTNELIEQVIEWIQNGGSYLEIPDPQTIHIS